MCNCSCSVIVLCGMMMKGREKVKPAIHHVLLIDIIKEITITSVLIRIYRINHLLQRVKTGFFFTLCSINLNMVSISGTGNVREGSTQ